MDPNRPLTAQYLGEPAEALAVWYSTIWIFWPPTLVVLANWAHDIEAGITPRLATSALFWLDSVGTSETVRARAASRAAAACALAAPAPDVACAIVGATKAVAAAATTTSTAAIAGARLRRDGWNECEESIAYLLFPELNLGASHVNRADLIEFTGAGTSLFASPAV
jgi:hypothetical protein